MNAHPTPLRFLAPAWFAAVMGLGGLALAWHRAAPAMGEPATGIASVIALAAGLVFAILLIACLVRAGRHAEALREDFLHPVRHPFVAAIPISVILLATSNGPPPVSRSACSSGRGCTD